MPTKSNALFSSRNGLDAQQDIQVELCSALSPEGPPDRVMAARGPEDDLLLSVRPLSPDTDVPVIYKWMTEEYAGLWDPEGPSLPFGEVYRSILESDAAQTFIGLVDNVPVCEIEIYKVRQHAISLTYESQPGDYFLDLLPASPAAQRHLPELLKNSLEYFFSFPEVSRIVADAATGNSSMNELLKDAGFCRYKKISMPYKISNLYILFRP